MHRFGGRDNLDVYRKEQEDEDVLHHRDAHHEAAEGAPAVHLPQDRDHARGRARDAEGGRE